MTNTPQDDPSSNFVRVANHFFDPYRNTALIPIPPWSQKAPDWAITGGGGVIGADNRFSIVKARDAMWRALTLKLSDATSDVPRPAHPQLPTSESLRIAYWATVFRSLGDAVHLLQDMAQPQHTRNDVHAGWGCRTSTEDCLLGHASYYEAYVESRVTGAPSFTLRDRYLNQVPVDVAEPVVASPPSYDGYPSGPAFPLDRFRKYYDFFFTGTGSQSLSGYGLANYSNRGFYTAGTNIGNSTYPAPPPAGEGLPARTLANGEIRNAGGEIVSGTMELRVGSVTDSLTGSVDTSVALATRGIFDQFLQPKGKVQYTLNHYNYADQARLLIPRAVAYSAGLIDFFFRGRLEFAPQTDGGVYALLDHTLQGCKDTCGFDKIRLKARNATPTDTLGGGMLVAVVKFRRNTCYTPDLSGLPGGSAFNGYACRGPEEEIVVSAPEFIPGLDRTAWTNVDFRFPKRIPINASDVQLQVVFRGVLGTEQDAVVVETHDIGEPTFYGFANVSDYYYVGNRDAYDPLPAGSSIDEVDLRLRFGDLASPVVATLAKLKATEHAQIAFLAEKGQLRLTREFLVSQGSALSPAWNYAPATEFVSRPAIRDYDASFHVGRSRGVWRQAYNFLYRPGDTAYDCQSHPEFCRQSTLAPLSPATAKPFQILF